MCKSIVERSGRVTCPNRAGRQGRRLWAGGVPTEGAGPAPGSRGDASQDPLGAAAGGVTEDRGCPPSGLLPGRSGRGPAGLAGPCLEAGSSGDGFTRVFLCQGGSRAGRLLGSQRASGSFTQQLFIEHLLCAGLSGLWRLRLLGPDRMEVGRWGGLF